jgi:hypothetical protein
MRFMPLTGRLAWHLQTPGDDLNQAFPREPRAFLRSQP